MSSPLSTIYVSEPRQANTDHGCGLCRPMGDQRQISVPDPVVRRPASSIQAGTLPGSGRAAKTLFIVP
jgi:hypothetical protein